jgi:hypothetical protein
MKELGRLRAEEPLVLLERLGPKGSPNQNTVRINPGHSKNYWLIAITANPQHTLEAQI